MKRSVALLIGLVLTFGFACAQADETAPIRQAVERRLQEALASWPGRSRFQIGEIRLPRLPASCQAWEVELPAHAIRSGKTHLPVRCRAPQPWLVLVPVEIEQRVPYLASARALAAGQVLTAQDVKLQEDDPARLPVDVLSDPQQAIGQTLNAALGSDRPLRASFLRVTPVVQQGQQVRVIARGPGFTVSDEGRALGNAGVGQLVQVRLGSGRLVSGIAREDGQVELGPRN